MKKIILLVLFLIMPQICSANFEISKWQYYKTILTEDGGLKKFIIDDQIFAGTERDLRDLRIMDKAGGEIPYKLIKSQAKSEQQTYYPKLINNSFEEGINSSVILDFGDNSQGINSLDIKTSSSNFQANVKVSGGDSLETLRTIKDDLYIYDYTDKKGDFKSQKTDLNFPTSVFRYIKIEIANNDSAQIKINSVTAQNRIVEPSKELERLAKFSLTEKESDTEILVDLEASGIPTNKLQLLIKDKNFNRGVSIFSSFDKEKWRNVGSGNIFRYDTPKFKGENLNLIFSETSDRYLKIVISNYDNSPIDIKEIKSFSTYREIIFQADAAKEYRVYYGNPKASFPRYDLDSYFQYLDLQEAKDVQLSTQNDNSAFQSLEKIQPKPKSEQVPWLMPFALVTSCLLLLFLVFRFFRK